MMTVKHVSIVYPISREGDHTFHCLHYPSQDLGPGPREPNLLLSKWLKRVPFVRGHCPCRGILKTWKKTFTARDLADQSYSTWCDLLPFPTSTEGTRSSLFAWYFSVLALKVPYLRNFSVPGKPGQLILLSPSVKGAACTEAPAAHVIQNCYEQVQSDG